MAKWLRHSVSPPKQQRTRLVASSNIKGGAGIRHAHQTSWMEPQRTNRMCNKHPLSRLSAIMPKAKRPESWTCDTAVAEHRLPPIRYVVRSAHVLKAEQSTMLIMQARRRQAWARKIDRRGKLRPWPFLRKCCSEPSWSAAIPRPSP